MRKPSNVIEHVRRMVLLHDGAEQTDVQLLDSFRRRRDEAAFAALVRRHGRMVWAVCRRVVGNHHDAEDAFQATFLVLARKADSITPPDKLASWLYGVAHTTAVRVRAAAAKHAARHRSAAGVPEAATRESGDQRELLPILDQELSRLPDKYRAPIVLCDLEERSIKEAARHLGWPLGTVAGRLARGRSLLAKRMLRYGALASGGAFAAGKAEQSAGAGLPTALLHSTIQAAGDRWATTAGPIPERVLALAEGVVKSMFLAKLKVGWVLLAVIALGLGAGTLRLRTFAAGQADEDFKPVVSPAGAQQKAETSDKSKPQATGKRYFFEARIVEAVAQDTAFPAEHEIMRLPRMSVYEGIGSKVLVNEINGQFVFTILAPSATPDDSEQRLGRSYAVSIEPQKSGKLRVNIDVQNLPMMMDDSTELPRAEPAPPKSDERAPEMITRRWHLSLDVHSSTIKKFVQGDRRGRALRWWEIIVDEADTQRTSRNAATPAPILPHPAPPALPRGYEVHCDVIEIAPNGEEKRLGSPTLLFQDDQTGSWVNGGDLAAPGGLFLPFGLSVSITVRKYGDKLRVDARMERTVLHTPDEKDEARVEGNSTRVVKLVKPDEEITLQLPDHGRDQRRARLRIRVNSAKE
jgi:RNA polymerase sigma factor (sigma-70 family)